MIVKPEIKRVEDLKGKKVGVTTFGSLTDFLVRHILRNAEVMVEEIAKVNSRAQEVKPPDLVDRRYLTEMENSGFFTQLWAEKC